MAEQEKQNARNTQAIGHAGSAPEESSGDA
jgi:hypothetical protein